MLLATLLEGLEVTYSGADPSAVDVLGVTERSCDVRPGSLFIARRGLRFDGRDHIPQALRAGACAVLVDAPPPSPAPAICTHDLPHCTARIAERFFGSPSSNLHVLGVTGTNGKTTIAHAVRHIMGVDEGVDVGGHGADCGLVGGVEISDTHRTTPATLTTPFAIDLSGHLRQMVDAGCSCAVIETSSHGLEQGRVGAIAYDHAIFSNLSGDHLDYHASMDDYARAKARLFEMLPQSGHAIVNADCPWSSAMTRATRARVL